MTISKDFKPGAKEKAAVNNQFEDVEQIIDQKLSEIDNLFQELEVEFGRYEIKNVSSAVLKYIKLRDKLGVARKSFESFESFAKGHQEVINEYLLKKSEDEGGIQNFNTPYGTAYRKTKISYRVQDWTAFSDWMQENNMLHCVEKRPAKLAVQEYFESVESENNDLDNQFKKNEISAEQFESLYKSPTPPGLERHVELEFGFRK